MERIEEMLRTDETAPREKRHHARRIFEPTRERRATPEGNPSPGLRRRGEGAQAKGGLRSARLEATSAGKLLCGLSAGAICWFRFGNSDSPMIEGSSKNKTMRLEGLDLVPLALCPHTLREEYRLEGFRKMMRSTPGIGIGLDDLCALQVRGDRYRIVSCLEGSVAHHLRWTQAETVKPRAARCRTLHEKRLPPHEDFRPLSEILSVSRGQ
jgi:hypothetical protein